MSALIADLSPTWSIFHLPDQLEHIYQSSVNHLVRYVLLRRSIRLYATYLSKAKDRARHQATVLQPLLLLWQMLSSTAYADVRITRDGADTPGLLNLVI